MGKTADRGRIDTLQAGIDLIDRMIAKYEAQKTEKLAEIAKLTERLSVK